MPRELGQDWETEASALALHKQKYSREDGVTVRVSCRSMGGAGGDVADLRLPSIIGMDLRRGPQPSFCR